MVALSRVAPNPVTIGSTAFINVGATNTLNTIYTATKYVLPSYVVIAILTGVCFGCHDVGTFRAILNSLHPTIATVVTTTNISVTITTF